MTESCDRPSPHVITDHKAVAEETFKRADVLGHIFDPFSFSQRQRRFPVKAQRCKAGKLIMCCANRAFDGPPLVDGKPHLYRRLGQERVRFVQRERFSKR